MPIRDCLLQLGPGEPRHDGRERLEVVLAEHDVRDAPLLAPLAQLAADGVARADERDAAAERLVRADLEARRHRRREPLRVVGDRGEEVADLELDLAEARTRALAHPADLLECLRGEARL